MNWNYRVISAPVKGRRARGVKGAEAQFALAVETVINEMAARGWEYCRAEMLPQEERRSRVTYRNLLVFRRQAGLAAPEGTEELSLREPVAERPGPGGRLRSGVGRLLDGVLARPGKRQEPVVAKGEAPLFQHEEMRRPSRPLTATPDEDEGRAPKAPVADPRTQD